MTQWRKKTEKDIDVEQLAQQVQQGNRAALAKAITLVESTNDQYRQIAERLLEKLGAKAPEFRIGVSGIPGAGKSTFIESIGLALCEQGKKVAVLTIDPSSRYSKGSILGDKTRMGQLSLHENAFVRPSPTGGTLGGVHLRTMEVMYLCAAAGFSTIFIETVGVGQSEGMVREMVDCFLLLLLSRTGDELQAVKRGIMELADICIINKADPTVRQEAEILKKSTEQMIHLFQSPTKGFAQQVWLHSVQTDGDREKIVAELEHTERLMQSLPSFEERRQDQWREWMRSHLLSEMERIVVAELSDDIRLLQNSASANKTFPFSQMRTLVNKWRSGY